MGISEFSRVVTTIAFSVILLFALLAFFLVSTKVGFETLLISLPFGFFALDDMAYWRKVKKRSKKHYSFDSKSANFS